MPNFRFHNLDIPMVQKLSGVLSVPLAEVVGCPVDWITFSAGSIGEGSVFCKGTWLKDTVFVYVEWFDRGQEVKDAVAKMITDGVFKSEGLKQVEITTVDVIFIDLKKTDYYENGEHF